MLGSSGNGVPLSELGGSSGGSNTLIVGVSTSFELSSTAVELASVASSWSRLDIPRFFPAMPVKKALQLAGG